MDNQVIMYGLIGIFAIFVLIVVAYLVLMKKMRSSDDIHKNTSYKKIFNKN